MKKILVSLSALILASCGAKYDPAALSEVLTKKLGVTVEVQVQATDSCGRKQLDSFHNEYSYLNSTSRQLVKDKLSQYEKVVFAPTNKVGTLKGKLFRLNLRTCDGSGYCTTQAKKVLADETVLEGSYPTTKVDATNTLVITTESLADLVDLQNYATKSITAYDLVDSMGEQFQTALDLGAIYFLNKNDNPGLECSTALKLIDIL